jgi:hypothetical protein
MKGMDYCLKSCIKCTFALLFALLKKIILECNMKKILSTKGSQSNATQTAMKIDRKKMFALAVSTFLTLVVLSESIRLVLMRW